VSEREQESQRNLRGLGEAVRRLREERGSSSADLASALGVHETRVQELEAGVRDPDYQLLLALARTLGVRPAELIGRAEELARER
jgi:transcriptional regulator with XRE-family HTH domain